MITLGCDPEFVFIDPFNRVCRADSFLQQAGSIGHDGPLGELRPNYGTHEDEVVENLRSLIHLLPDKIQERFKNPKVLVPEAYSEKNNLALGFHTHIGGIPKMILEVADSTANSASRKFVDNFITAMDYFVGIPAMLLEDNDVRRLGDGQYGGAGDWRVSVHKTLEYRTPGGFLLRSPGYSAGILGLSLCAARSILSWVEEKSVWKHLYKIEYADFQKKFGLPKVNEIKEVFEAPDKKAARKFLLDIIKGVEKMEFYVSHKQSIRHYIRLTLENKQYNPQILANW